jgi:curved DNA-binding protein CbpA
MDDPYKVLGVAPGASREEIGQAYRTLVRRFPPELNPGRFARIQHAYELLRSYERAMEEAYQAPDAALEALFPPPQIVLRPLAEAPGPLDAQDLEPFLQLLRRAELERLLRECLGACMGACTGACTEK